MPAEIARAPAGTEALDVGTSESQCDAEQPPTQVADWLTQRQLARHWQCSIATIGRLRPPRHLLGASPRYLRSEVDAWLASRTGGAP